MPAGVVGARHQCQFCCGAAAAGRRGRAHRPSRTVVTVTVCIRQRPPRPRSGWAHRDWQSRRLVGAARENVGGNEKKKRRDSRRFSESYVSPPHEGSAFCDYKIQILKAPFQVKDLLIFVASPTNLGKAQQTFCIFVAEHTSHHNFLYAFIKVLFHRSIERTNSLLVEA